MRFVSSSAVVRGDGGLDVTGDVTIRGVTRRMVVPVRVLPLESAGGPAVARFETTFNIDRTDFGLVGRPSYKGMSVSIGRSVRIHLAIATSLSPLLRR
jgi:polyisoprenoid-binding protein YceI